MGTLPLVGVDVGGTFTDFVVLRASRLQVYKLSTTPADQSQAILAGLRALGIEEAEIVHGMTVATNALLERRGATTALVTTAGFADTLIIGRQNRPHLYRLSQQRAEPLVGDPLRFEVTERLDHTGAVLQPLDEDGVLSLVQQIRDAEVESLAIVLLFSFRNPTHEQRVAALLRRQLPDLPISLSSEILPEYREYERTTTTVINAYVRPLVARYLHRLEDALAHRDEGGQAVDGHRLSSNVRIMQSNGGAIGIRQASAQAARLVLSGPAGGVVGAFEVARQALQTQSLNRSISWSQQSERLSNEEIRLITFDMGGTSTDVALCPGQIPTTAESIVAGLPLRLPVIDIHTVGAGGGSIAYVDAGGVLRVGPRSAGAVPGPACYGRGGVEPTVTDANLVLGRLDPGGFLGGRGDVALDRAAAHRALEQLGGQLGLDAEAAALGVIRIVNATMERALRRVSVERGHDPRQFILFPFGGAGPLHACDLAAALGIRHILIPPFPGVLSAYGMLVADIVSDASHSILQDAETLLADLTPLRQALQSQEARVRTVLAGEAVAAPAISAALDLRYRGQSYELTVPLDLPLDDTTFRRAVDTFHQTHEQRYGYAMAGEQVQVVTLRIRGSGPGARPELPSEAPGSPDAGAACVSEQPVWFDPTGPTATPCFDRTRLRAGHRFDGPAMVFQFDATTVVLPGWEAQVDELGNLWLSVRKSENDGKDREG
jgi:N-methylhydantoinase A